MVEACGDLADPDFVLAIAPPVPRRVFGAPSPQPQPPAARPVPPPVPAATAAAATPLVLESDADVPAGRWPDRRWWTATTVSLVVHVAMLMVLALIVERPADPRRPRPIEFVWSRVEPDPLPFVDPEEQVAIELVEPADAPPVDALFDAAVEPASALFDGPAINVAAAAFEASVEPVEGIAELDPAGMVARIGAPATGRPGPGGFGGDVGRRLARAGAKSGDIQIALSWENFNDIDLHVVAPSGERIFFGHPRSRCRGLLDVDMNATGPVSRTPVENIFWPTRTAPPGEYQVFVHHFARHDRADSTAFVLHVLVNGVRRRFSGSVTSGDPPVSVTRFTRTTDRSPPDEFVE